MTDTLQSREAYITIHPRISPHATEQLKIWRDELDLRRKSGRKLTVPELATIILEDFAEEYELTKKQQEQEQ